MTKPSAETPGLDREAVARIIDPSASTWTILADVNRESWIYRSFVERWERARQSRRHPGRDCRQGAGEVEALRAALDAIHAYVDAHENELAEAGTTRDDVLLLARDLREAVDPISEREGRPFPGAVLPAQPGPAIAETIRLKTAEPSFVAFGEALRGNLTEAGHLLAFKVRPTGTASMWVRLASGREIIVGEDEWTPAQPGPAPVAEPDA